MVATVRLTPFQSLQVILHEAGFDTHLVEATEIPLQPYEQLWIQEQGGTPDPALILRLLFQNDILKTGLAQSKLPINTVSPILLQFVLALPVTVRPDQLSEIAYFTMVLNRYMGDGALCVTPEDGLYLRYGLLHPDRNVNSKIVVEVCSHLFNLAKLQVPWFESLLSGKQSLDALLQSIHKTYGGPHHES